MGGVGPRDDSDPGGFSEAGSGLAPASRFVTPRHTRTIVCLANSRKHSGRCVAGKEFLGRRAGGWIRPVSRLQSQELSEEDMRYENGEYPKLLYVVQIPVTEEAP